MSRQSSQAYRSEPSQPGADGPRMLARAGAAGTLALVLLMLPARRRGWTRLNFGRLLGSALARDSAGARAVGWGLFCANGVLLARGYRWAFAQTGVPASAASGAALGSVHGAVALLGLAAAPYLHPRPDEAGLVPLTKAAYGPLTVPIVLGGHALYGGIVGSILAQSADPPAAK